jgi:hypothetical protein
MKIEITTEEKQEILKFSTKIGKKFEDGEVYPIPSSKESKDFVRGFLKSRGIEKPRVYEQGIYAFGDVGMHTDSLSPKSAMTMCLLISGSGKLFAWDGKKVNECRINKGEGVIFDFNLPHSFEADKTCQAFLVDVPKKYKKNLQNGQYETPKF